eukprot:gene31077-38406_t
MVTTTVGSATGASGNKNGTASSSLLSGPAGLWMDTSSNTYIADKNNNRIRLVSNSIVSTFAGNGLATSAGVSISSTSTALSGPSGVWGDSNGFLYVVEQGANKIRAVGISSGAVTNFAG